MNAAQRKAPNNQRLDGALDRLAPACYGVFAKTQVGYCLKPSSLSTLAALVLRLNTLAPARFPGKGKLTPGAWVRKPRGRAGEVHEPCNSLGNPIHRELRSGPNVKGGSSGLNFIRLTYSILSNQVWGCYAVCSGLTSGLIPQQPIKGRT